MKALIPFFLLSSFLLNNVAAQPGSLDAGFGVNGMVGYSFEDTCDILYEGQAILETPNGKILAAGISETGGALARFHGDGTIDTLGGDNFWGIEEEGGALVFVGGWYLTEGTIGGAAFYDIALQPDGKMIAVGTVLKDMSNKRYILLRQNADGSYDPTFGEHGYGFSIAKEGMSGHSVAIQPDGKILVGGTNFVARYLPNGHVDSSFATNGIFKSIGGLVAARAMLLQPDGKIVMAGSAMQPQVFSLARINTDGTWDTEFGTNGVVTADISNGTDIIYSLELLPDGNILAIGTSGANLAVAKFNDGLLDAGYGENGVAFAELTDKFLVGNSSVLQPDGKLVVAGYADSDFLLARFTADGFLDNVFGDEGLVLTEPSAGLGSLFDVNIQQDGKIIATGYSRKQCLPINTWKEFVIIRYHSGLGVDASEKVANMDKLIVSPNPTSATLNFRLRDQAFSPKATFHILNAQGQWLKTIESISHENNMMVPVQDWPTGMYFLQYLEDGEVKAVERFVVQK